MADISKYLDDILTSVYGKDVRKSIHDGIEIINNELEIDTDNFGSARYLSLGSTSYVNSVIDVSRMPFENGTYGTSDGKKYDNSNYIRTSVMFPVPDRYHFKNDVMVYVLYYNEELLYTGHERFTNYGSITLTPPEGSVFMNLVLGDFGGESDINDKYRIEFMIYGKEYKRGSRIPVVATDTSMQSSELYVSDEKRIVARSPYRYNGTLELYKNGYLVSSRSVNWYENTYVENTDMYDFAILKSDYDGTDLGNSFVLGSDKDRLAVEFDVSESVSHGSESGETTADQQYVTNPTDIYFLIRFPNLRLYTFSTSQSPSEVDYRWCSGVLRLPKGYSPIGKKSPIALFTHGTSGWVGNGAVQSQFNRCNYLVDNGIACFDVNGWTGCYGSDLPPADRYNGQNMGNPGGCACAHKAFEYIKHIYNVDDRCLVVGNSMGGLLALNYANNYRGDVMACFLLYPVIDLKRQAWENPWNDRCKSNITSFYNMEEKDVWDDKCVYGYNPYNNNYCGIPIFIWHGASDVVVNPETSKSFASNQNSAGGSVYLRMVDGLGHGEYDKWKNIFETESLYAINRFITTTGSLS